MSDIIERLKEAAAKATPGPYTHIALTVKNARGETICHFGISNDFRPPRPYECQANAAFYSLASPENILSLLAALEAAESRISTLQAELAAVRGLVEQSLSAINASYRQAQAETQGHDRTADKYDREVQAYRAAARAALNPEHKAT